MVAENTKKLIEEKGFKQKHVALLAGYTEKKFSAMLNGRSTIREMDVMRIANALEVTPNDLFGIETSA